MRGALTGQRYVDDILRPRVGPVLMLVRIQQELLKTSYVIFRLFHGRPAPRFVPCKHVWDQLKWESIVSLCT
ncbi:hypothetical protein TNCV_890361 [Trichonephila clavipes]|nr:hypothetical protein TNCV_890361 [Trichonephila clavipes]